jgi:NADH-quinone oxidoreductase subunit N
MQEQWQQVIAFLAGASMVVGSFAGLVQTNLKRLMAYSSIANMGFVLMALAAGAPDGAEAALIYVAVYVPATIGVFAILMTLKARGEAIEQVADLAGLGQRHVAYGGLLTVLVFSLAGIPPLAGFWGKYNALLATLGANLTVLAVIGALCAVVSLGYYLRILSVVWFSPAAASEVRPSGVTTSTLAVIGAAFAFAVLNIAMPGLEDTAEAAVRSSFLR